jgi:hypothetical protein
MFRNEHHYMPSAASIVAAAQRSLAFA